MTEPAAPANEPATPVILPPPVAALPPLDAPRLLRQLRVAWLTAAVLGLLAIASVVLAYRADRRIRTVEQELVLRQQDSGTKSAEAQLIAKQAQDAARDAAAKVALLEARVAEIAAQRSRFEELMQSMSRSRDDNVLLEVESTVRGAVQQAAVTGRVEPVVAALKQADERLGRHSQPRFERVRRAIARDLDRIKSASVADLATLTIQLDEAARMIDELPLLSDALSSRGGSTGDLRQDGATGAKVTSAAAPASAGVFASGSAAPARLRPAVSSAASASPASSSGLSASSVLAGASEPSAAPRTGEAGEAGGAGGDAGTAASAGFQWPGWSLVQEGAERLVRQVWNAIRSLVRVTRIDHPDAVLLAPEHGFFIKENLKLRLLNAKLALLSHQFDTAQADLQAAQSMVERYFDRKARRTVTVSEVLRQVALQARQGGVPRPEDTLAALAATESGR